MLGKSGASSSSANNRIFLYEIEGLKQNDQMDNNSYPIRNSGTMIMQVSYNCMNFEMRRINRLGGRIVNIRPLSASTASEG
jgi:hypothetical protein